VAQFHQLAFPHAGQGGGEQQACGVGVAGKVADAALVQGERRQPSGPLVTGQIDIDQAAGAAAAIRAKLISSGEVTGSATANRVEQGGKLTAVEIDHIG
jgi:hypothetical protein